MATAAPGRRPAAASSATKATSTTTAAPAGEPIGNNPPSNYYSASFRGNGHVVRNLFANRPTGSSVNFVGLFGVVNGGVRVESLGLPDAYVRANYAYAGVLAGWAYGEVVGCYSTGTVIVRGTEQHHARIGGGLLGALGSFNPYGTGSMTASYSVARVTSDQVAGGLIGDANGHIGPVTVHGSWAAGLVSGRSDLSGGLVGRHVFSGSTATASYYDEEAAGQMASRSGVGQSTADLKRPTGYTGIYATWNADLDGDGGPDDPWHFGTSGQYPSLKWGGFDPARQFAVPPPAPDRGGPPAPVDLPPEALAELADAVPGRRRDAGHRPGRGVPGSGRRPADLRGVQFRSGRGLGFGSGTARCASRPWRSGRPK